MSDISVLGIFVADISFSGSKIPAVGETILGNKYNVGPGGKGCNQAVAIARLGAKVNFISKIGKDSYGELALNTLTKNKINIATFNLGRVSPDGEAIALIQTDQICDEPILNYLRKIKNVNQVKSIVI